MDKFWQHGYVVALLATVVLGSVLSEDASRVAPRQIAGQPSGTPTVEVQQLVAGLGYNIMAQKGEIAVASMMQSLVQMPTPDPALFNVAKDDLMSFMSAGMRIRANNLNLSKVNPQVTRGLAQLEQTQVLQMALANSLNGTAADAPTLQKLQGQIEGAIQKNQGLQSIATGGSGVPMITKPKELIDRKRKKQDIT